MNLRWLWGNYADPEFKLTAAEQRAVTRLAHEKHLPRRRLALWTGAMLVLGWIAFGLGHGPLKALLAPLGVAQAWLASAVIWCALVSIIAAWFYRFLYAGPVRRAMREMGHDICIGCGYRLIGLPPSIDRCPECGEQREPMAPPSEPNREDARPR
jgi:hypothetical protein